MPAFVQVAEYHRDLGASLDRMFENALDWEHLPHVHARTFDNIAIIEERASGWRANVGMVGGRHGLDGAFFLMIMHVGNI